MRELKEGARPLDLNTTVLVSPCDALVGAHGTVIDGMVLQAKGFPYPSSDFFYVNWTFTLHHSNREVRKLMRRHIQQVSDLAIDFCMHGPGLVVRFLSHTKLN